MVVSFAAASVAISPMRRTRASSLASSFFCSLRAASREALRLSEGTVGPIVYSRDGRSLASGGDDNVVTVRDIASGAVRAVLRGHREQLVSLAFTPDGRTLASSAADGTLRLWHVPTWRELGSLQEGRVFSSLAFDARSGDLMATDVEGRTQRFPGPE